MKTWLPAAILALLAAPVLAADLDLPEPPPGDWLAQADLFGAVAQSADDDRVVAWETRHANALSAGYLFDLARRLLPRDPDRALEWYVVAQVRGRYDAGRCVDDTAERAVSRLARQANSVLRYGEARRAEFAAAGQRAMARPDLLAHTVSPDWICAQGLSGMGGRSAGTTPPATWPKLENRLRSEWSRQFEAMARR
ncbi:hypothetical protein [Magnetospirillum aberrantis]|uniref:Sel1 repeat family protein n=1 Tax=Magnetospirillum aberrantis SpK TaxID=908842 RepID=A0A7C9UWW3_9PROT|nr:hypothetical protein [Magnetospirillum aberrantis]NFV78711.1 hypothetical protein [Magnetospirillum aberrantis SpK]